MSSLAVRLAGITKRYRSNTVLGPIDLDLKPGRVYGLIGENGAGKSTLIRILMGLSKPTSGTIEIMDASTPDGLRRSRAQIGYVPDSSASYPLLSAADNLKARCLEWGLDQRQVPRILNMVGLTDTGGKRARSFSLGMRKRLDLGIALLGQPRMLVLDEPTNGLDPLGTIEIRELIRARSFSLGMRKRLDLGIALLGQPRMLVLDEPTNGLDPLGTIEIRELIKRLNRELGTTVLISSHNLAELHQTVTDYIILSSGALVAQLTAYDVDDLSGGDLEQLYAYIMLGRDGRVSSRRGYPRGSASAWKGDHHDR